VEVEYEQIQAVSFELERCCFEASEQERVLLCRGCSGLWLLECSAVMLEGLFDTDILPHHLSFDYNYAARCVYQYSRISSRLAEASMVRNI